MRVALAAVSPQHLPSVGTYHNSENEDIIVFLLRRHWSSIKEPSGLQTQGTKGGGTALVLQGTKATQLQRGGGVLLAMQLALSSQLKEEDPSSGRCRENV